ncbi:hypothetical protein BV22DRAFT_854764 [Leucogyrophana mollusca]|uniref:Uncharacterized protein n=1 Tax=Leucogyrophana mollusca TaxID=85980 RepID=A0ACB8B1L2_9AGAM|nr:hypothetical protein BV22DRAFT_854764 [Leucogyrophana mollusca]
MATGIVVIFVGDMLTTSILAYFFCTKRSGNQRTDRIIQRLLLYTVATGAITSLVEIASMVTYFAVPHNLTYLGFMLVQSHLYTNSLFTSLNMRRRNAKILNAPTMKTTTSHLVFRAPDIPERFGQVTAIVHDASPDDSGGFHPDEFP